MENRVVIVVAFILLFAASIPMPTSAGPRVRRQAPGDPNAQFLQAFQNLFNAASSMPLQFQQQFLSLVNNGAGISVQFLQNVQALFQQAASTFTSQQAQSFQAALSALQSLAQAGSTQFLQLIQQNQTQLNAMIQAFQTLLTNLQAFQTGLTNLIAQNPGNQQLISAINSLLSQLNAGGLSSGLAAALSNIANGGIMTFQQMLAFIANAGNQFGRGIQDAALLITNLLGLGIQTVQNVVVNPLFNLLQALAGIIG